MADRPETKTVLTRTATVAAAKEGQNLAAATRVGRYMVLSKVGAGGMGEVYAAYDPKLDRRVALKVLHRMESAAGAERLLREARALARLSHPNVVTVHEIDELLEVDGQPLIAMEFVEGHTLKRWVGKATPTAEETVERLELLIQAGKGLVAAHEQGLVHRDFKPGNVLVGMDGRARVADFGLAVGVGESGVGSSGSPDDSLLETSQAVTQKLN
ncbi:MAG: serine/threonine-protein kinase [Myxococcota bacterium]